MKLLKKDIVPNERITTYFTLEAMEPRESRNKNPYLVLTLSDKTGTIKGYLWSNPAKAACFLKERTFVKVTGYARELNGATIINVKKIRTARVGEIDIEDFPGDAPYGQLKLFTSEDLGRQEEFSITGIYSGKQTGNRKENAA